MQRLEAEVVEHQQVGTQIGLEAPLQGAVGAAAIDVLEHLVGVDEQGGVATATRLVGQRLGQVGLAHAGGAADQYVVFVADVGAGGQIQHLLAVEAGVEVEVEAFHCFGSVDGCPANAQRQLLLGTSFYLVFQQASQELDIGPLGLNGLLVTNVQRFQDA